MQSTRLQLAKQIADCFALLQHVEAVALGGSHGRESGTADRDSDLDLYVYSRGDIPLETRCSIVEQTGGATQSSLNLNYWGRGDEWLNAPTGIEIDIVYFDASWMEEQITRVVERCEASLGYTTCFWRTICRSIVFSDPHGWFAELRRRCEVPYPEALRRNIVALNHPVLRGIIPSYANQIAKAARRQDLLSINHRLAAFFASYFDIIFAVNRELHPGEKRLLQFALNGCRLLPENMETDIASILLMASADIIGLPGSISRLLDNLDQLLANDGFAGTLSSHPAT
ncbi:MAG: DUF4037 domain-containing protein [Terrimicrobiaceae bacterium]